MNEIPAITYIIGQHDACAWYRCYTPGTELHRRGFDVVVDHRVDPRRLQKTDVLVLLRPNHSMMVRLSDHARDSGKCVVVDIDDDLWNIHPGNPAYGVWTVERRTVLEECIRCASLVTVTTETLATIVRPMNSNVIVLPNMLPGDHWPAKTRDRGREARMRIGWAGSATHRQDLGLISGAIATILEQYPCVDVCIAGMPKGMAPFKRHDRLHYRKSVDIEHYASLLDEFDIGLAPVVDGRFNRCKSDLRYLECAMMRMPVVASKSETYARSIKPGENGLLARNTKDWIQHLRRLIEDQGLRDRLADNARSFAETRLIKDNIHLWMAAYRLS